MIPDAEVTAAYYYGGGRYDYKLSDRLYYTLGGGWERNRFSGIEHRWLVDTGLGYILLNNDRTSFSGGLGINYTHEQYTVEDDRDGSFFGARGGWDFSQKLFASTTLTHTLIADENLEDTGDLRLDSQLGLHVAMSSRLGLKVNWRLLWDNQPASPSFRSRRAASSPESRCSRRTRRRTRASRCPSSSASPRPRRADALVPPTRASVRARRSAPLEQVLELGFVVTSTGSATI